MNHKYKFINKGRNVKKCPECGKNKSMFEKCKRCGKEICINCFKPLNKCYPCMKLEIIAERLYDDK